jgi:TPP-dependent 2-oxoacid decarboxylase
LSVKHLWLGTHGIALAQQGSQTGRRTISFQGVGSIQAAVQEVTSIIKHKLNTITFIMENDVHMYERLIYGRDVKYNNVATVALFGGT